MKNPAYDAIIVGGGAAGLMCAIQAGQRGRRVLLLDHAKAVGQKVLISGGGRCNFTNLKVSSEDYVSENPHFCKSALSRYAPQDFIDLVQSYKIHFHEKKLGQLFCDHSSKNILQMLLAECGKAKVNFQFETRVNRVSRENSIFTLETDRGPFQAPALVVATGGLSFPKLGATDFGYRLAEQFGLKIVAPEAALDGFGWGRIFCGTSRIFRGFRWMCC